MDYENRFNTKFKVYPDGNFKATYCNKCIFPNPEIEDKKLIKKEASTVETLEDWEVSLRKIEKSNEPLKSISAKELEDNNITNFQELLEYTSNKNRKKKNKNSTGHNLERSLKRAKERIFDIAYINDFKYFFTLTLNKEKINRYDVKGFMKKLRSWLNNKKQKYYFDYILVPEYHKDGAIHVHGLLTDTNMPMIDSGKRTSKGQVIYNCPDWKYGFTTFIPVYKAVNDSNIKLAHYITKYMTKDVHKIFGKFYWSSKGLKREVDVQLFNSDYDKLPLKEYEIPNTNIRLKYDSQFDYVIGGKTKTHEKGS